MTIIIRIAIIIRIISDHNLGHIWVKLFHFFYKYTIFLKISDSQQNIFLWINIKTNLNIKTIKSKESFKKVEKYFILSRLLKNDIIFKIKNHGTILRP